jgi:hypothetical protein
MQGDVEVMYSLTPLALSKRTGSTSCSPSNELSGEEEGKEGWMAEDLLLGGHLTGPALRGTSSPGRK